MVISAERAFWLLEFYRRRETRLIFGGRILGEEAGCSAVVLHVWSENQALGIKLLSDEGDQSWDRLIPLTRAEFFFLQMGDPEFEQFARARCHSVLVIRFTDGTTMFLAEQVERMGNDDSNAHS